MPRRCSTRRLPSTHLSLERLEARDVPAGNITANIVDLGWGPILQLDGDATGNQITLQGNNVPGQVQVRGMNTTINGGTQPITFTGIVELWVDTADGNDEVQALKLNIPQVGILGGAGDDRLEVRGYALESSFGFLTVQSDFSFIAPSDFIAGNDTILITDTTVTADYFALTVDSGNFADDSGEDSITINNTHVTGQIDLFVNTQTNGNSTSGDGVDITINNLDWINTGIVSSSSYWPVLGTGRNDHFSLNNINISVHAEKEVYFDWFVGSWEGNDTLDVTNLNLETQVSQTTGTWPFDAPVNQVYVTFAADTIRARNIDFESGMHYLDLGTQEIATTGGSLQLLGNVVDARNVQFHTNGWGSLLVSTGEYWIDGLVRDDSFTLVNVNVTSWNDSFGDVIVDGGSGNDRAELVNTSTDNFFAFMGDGDDTLILRNMSIVLSALLDGGSGNDHFHWHNVHGPLDYLDFENV